MTKTEIGNELYSILEVDESAPDGISGLLSWGIDNLDDDKRKKVEECLSKHFEFSRIEWMDYPAQLTKKIDQEKRIIAVSLSLNVDDSTKHTGQVGYIYKINFTPIVYDPNDLYLNPVKDGCTFGPIIYNPDTFEPHRTITLSWSPEQSINTPVTDEECKQIIRDKLNQVLDNPEQYMPKGYRGVMLRYAII